ncbi:MAG: tetratricopeptide repeat protein [Verrucomicrobiota bacterium]
MEQHPVTRTPSCRADLLAGLALLVITGCVFWPSLSADFVRWDDEVNIYGNSHIQKLDRENLRWMLTDFGYMRRYVPLTWLSWAISYQLGNGEPVAFHAGNLLLHLVNVLLVYWILRRLLLRWQRGRATRESPAVWVCAGLATLFWAIHPLRVEVVAWASSRGHVQGTFFALVAVASYLKAIADESRSPLTCPWFWGAVAAYGAALLSYPIGIGLVAVFPVIDCFWRSSRRSLIEKLPFVILAAAVLAITVWARTTAGGIWSPPPTLAAFGVADRVMQAFYIAACYVWKPWLQTSFSPVYTTLVDFNPFAPLFLVSALVVIGFTILAVWGRRRWPALTALWVCHLVLLVPVLGLTEHPHYASDRYAYLQGICWSVLIALGLLWTRRQLTLGLLLVISGLAGWRTYRQTQVWDNTVTLFTHVIKTLGPDPYRANIYVRLGSYYWTRDVPQALENYATALAIEPNCFPAFKQRGLLRLRTDDTGAAIADLQQARAIRPDAEVSHGLAIACVKAGRFANGRHFFDEALQLDPTDASTYYDYALFLSQQGSSVEALGYVRQALQRNPRDERAKALLGKLTAHQL